MGQIERDPDLMEQFSQQYVQQLVQVDEQINHIQGKIQQKQQFLDTLRDQTQNLHQEMLVRLGNNYKVVGFDKSQVYTSISLVFNVVLVIIIAWELQDIIQSYKRVIY